MLMKSVYLYSSGTGVKRVHVVLCALRIRLFMHIVHVVMVMSSAYVVSFTATCGGGMFDVYVK